MSYPQPSSEAPVKANQNFFRLLTNAIDDGDIYESKVGAQSFALGPQSDFSKVNIGYWDEAGAGHMSIATIDPSRAFVGSVYAHNEQGADYAVSNLPGRILIWPGELYNPSWYPLITNTSQIRVDWVTPVLDVIQYFGAPPSVTPQRNDKSYHWQNLPWKSGDSVSGNYIMVPYYGRKFASILFTNLTESTIDFSVQGVNFFYASSGAGFTAYVGDTQELLASVTTPVAPLFTPPVPTKCVVKASVNGMFDYLQITLNNFENAPAVPVGAVDLRVIVSDNQL